MSLSMHTINLRSKQPWKLDGRGSPFTIKVRVSGRQRRDSKETSLSHRPVYKSLAVKTQKSAIKAHYLQSNQPTVVGSGPPFKLASDGGLLTPSRKIMTELIIHLQATRAGVRSKVYFQSRVRGRWEEMAVGYKETRQAAVFEGQLEPETTSRAPTG